MTLIPSGTPSAHLRRKAWFVFVGDTHRGPFTADEIFAQLNEGLLAPEDLAWCDGMADWRSLREVPLFGYRARAPQATVLARTTVARPPFPRPRTAHAADSARRPAHERRTRKLAGAAVSVVALTALAIAFSTTRVNVPELADVSPEERMLLSSTAESSSLFGAPVGVALAISRERSLTPVIYSTSNDADAAIEVVVQGIAGTMIGRPRVFLRQEIALDRGFGKTEPFRLANGAPLPRGEYRIYARLIDRSAASVDESALRKNIELARIDRGAEARPVAVRGYFLGGARDEAYATALREYHLRLQEEAKLELQELGQIATTLESQFAKSLAARTGGAKTRAAVGRAWASLQKQLSESFRVWAESARRGDFYYGDLYGKARTLGEEVGRLQNDAPSASASADFAARADRLTEGLRALRTEIAQLAARSPSANGLPPR